MAAYDKEKIRFKTYFCDTIEQVSALYNDESIEKMMNGGGSIVSGPMPSGKGYFYREEFPGDACMKCFLCPCLVKEVEGSLQEALKMKDGKNHNDIRPHMHKHAIKTLRSILGAIDSNELPPCINDRIKELTPDHSTDLLNMYNDVD